MMGWTAPERHRCARLVVMNQPDKGAVHERDYPNWDGYVEVYFQLHGVDASERVVLRKRLARKAMQDFFAKLPPTVMVMEACGVD